MTFEYKRQFPKNAKSNDNGHSNGNGSGAGPHEPAANPAATATANTAANSAATSTVNPPASSTTNATANHVIEPMKVDSRVSRYIPTPPPPRDYGREGALARAERQSAKSLRLREHLDCEPPWDVTRVRASFDRPASPREPWPDRFDIWPKDMAGYWPCPVCATALPTVARTAMKLFRCMDCETETFVHVTAPVVHCPHHGRQEIDLPWMQNDLKWAYLGIDPPEIHPVGSGLRDISELKELSDGSETEH